MKRPSSERILHVFDSIDQLRFWSPESFAGVEENEKYKHLISLHQMEEMPLNKLGIKQSVLSFDQGLSKEPVMVLFHSMTAAVQCIDRMEGFDFSVKFRNYSDPLKDAKLLTDEKSVILRQRKVLEKSKRILIDFENQKKLIEDWFVELNIFGGGEYYYNFDQAQRITEKCLINPYLPNHGYWDPTAVSDNKMLWLGAVYGIDLKQKYLSVYGPGTDWDRLFPYYRAILNQDPLFRIVVFDEAPLEAIRESAMPLGIPSSYFTQISPSKKHLKVCIKMTVGSLFFPVLHEINYDMLAAFMLMNVPIFSDSASPWSAITEESWATLDKDEAVFKISYLEKTRRVREEVLTLYGPSVLESKNSPNLTS